MLLPSFVQMCQSLSPVCLKSERLLEILSGILYTFIQEAQHTNQLNGVNKAVTFGPSIPQSSV
jgi:hypothetical protein